MNRNMWKIDSIHNNRIKSFCIFWILFYIFVGKVLVEIVFLNIYLEPENYSISGV